MASPLQKFTQSAAGKAFSVIGTEAITIDGGAEIYGVLNESDQNRDYEAGGFEQTAALEFVIDYNAFSAKYLNGLKSYQGNKATARGENWRVSTIRGGQKTDGQFVTISLIAPNKSA